MLERLWFSKTGERGTDDVVDEGVYLLEDFLVLRSPSFIVSKGVLSETYLHETGSPFASMVTRPELEAISEIDLSRCSRLADVPSR